MKDSPFLQRRYYRKFAERWDAVFGRFGLNSRNSTFIIFSASSHCRSSFSSIRELSHQCKLAQGPACWRNFGNSGRRTGNEISQSNEFIYAICQFPLRIKPYRPESY